MWKNGYIGGFYTGGEAGVNSESPKFNESVHQPTDAVSKQDRNVSIVNQYEYIEIAKQL